jgi:uncharacterized membrane protein
LAQTDRERAKPDSEIGEEAETLVATRVKDDLDTLTGVIQEAIDQVRAFEKAVQALQKARPGTNAYDEAEADLAVEAYWLKMKAEAIAEMLEEA